MLRRRLLQPLLSVRLLALLLALLAAAPALAQAPSLDQARQQLERIDARLMRSRTMPPCRPGAMRC